MTSTWWMLEAEIISRKTKQKTSEIEEIFKAGVEVAKELFINLLGLNVMLKDGENGVLEEPKQGDFLPMTLFVGRPEILTQVYERFEKFSEQKKATKDIPVDTPVEEDLEFIDDLDKEMGHLGKSSKEIEWNSKETQNMLKQLVIQVDDDGLPLPDDDLMDMKKVVPNSLMSVAKKRFITIDSEE